MPSRQQLIDALRQADASADTNAAQRFAAMLKSPAAAPQAAPPQSPEERAAAAGRQMGSEENMASAFANHVADTGTFGLNHYVNAGARYLGQRIAGVDNPDSFDSDLAYSRGVTEGAGNANPTSAIAGDVGGLFTGGGLIGATLKGAKALPLVGKVAQGADSLLAARAGQPLANVARAAATGGVVAGLDSAGHGGNVDQDLAAAATGAVLGPVAGKIGGAVVKRLAPVAARAMSLLSDKIGETPATLQRAYTNFQQATGRVPTMAELVGMKSRGELAAVAGDNPTVGVALNRAADTAGQARPGALAGQITQNAGGPVQDINSLVKAQGARMDAAMKPIRSSQVPLDSSAADLLNDPRVRNATAADPELRAKLAKTLTDIGDSGQSSMSIDDIDSLRQSIRSRQAAYANVNNVAHNSQVARQFGRIADEVTDLTAPHVPEYKAALDQFGTDQSYIDAFKHGMGGKSIGEAEDPSLIRTLGTPEGQQGHASGVMSRLAGRAGDTESGANATALDLTQPGTIRAVSEAVGPQKAARLAEAAAYERKSAEALNQIAPGGIKPQPDGGDVQHAAHAVAAATYHSPTAIGYHISRIFGGKVKMSAAVQAKVAQYLADPKMTQQGIALLRRAGAANEDIRRLQTAISGAVGVQAGNALAGGQ